VGAPNGQEILVVGGAFAGWFSLLLLSERVMEVEESFRVTGTPTLAGLSLWAGVSWITGTVKGATTLLDGVGGGADGGVTGFLADVALAHFWGGSRSPSLT